MARTGRPTKLDEKMTKRLCEAIKLGMSRERAAYLVGIDRVTIQRWIKAGEGKTKGVYADFCNSLKKAESDAIEIDIKNLRKAARNGAWQASAWMLERRYPQEYGRNRTEDEPGTAKSIADAISIIRGEKPDKEGKD